MHAGALRSNSRFGSTVRLAIICGLGCRARLRSHFARPHLAFMVASLSPGPQFAPTEHRSLAVRSGAGHAQLPVVSNIYEHLL